MRNPLARLWPFARKDNPVANVIVLNLSSSGTPVTPKQSLALQAEEGYLKNVSVFACVNLLARAVAGVPWMLVQKGATTTSKPRKVLTLRTAAKAFSGPPRAKATLRNAEIENHRLLMLLEKPNPMQGGPEYTETVFGYFLINGNSFETWVTPETGPNRGLPLELWSMRPDRMKIIGAKVGEGRLVDRYEYWIGVGREAFAVETILHQKFFSPLDDFWGLSPIQVASRTIDGDNAAAAWNANLLQNDARPPAALIVKSGLNELDRERVKEDLKLRFSGPNNARRPALFEGDVDWKILAANPADLDWIEGRKMNQREIAVAYGVESIVDLEAQGYASKESARKSLYHETILPMLDRRRDNLNNSLTPLFGDGLYLDYDRDQIEALHDDTQKLYQGLKQADWISINEKRGATGYDDYTGDAETDKAADVPIALLKPAVLPGTTADLGLDNATGEGGAPMPPEDQATKEQDLNAAQRAIEKKLQKKLDAHFRAQGKALAAHMRKVL